MRKLLAASCFMIVSCSIFCSGQVSPGGVVERRLNPRFLEEFFLRFCTHKQRSRLVLYVDMRSGGWWSSILSSRLQYFGGYLSRNGISITIIDLSYHPIQKLPKAAMPPAGSATLVSALYDGTSVSVGALLKRSSDSRLFRSRFEWLLLTPEHSKNDLEHLFRKMAVYPDSNVRYGVVHGSREIKIFEVYHVALDKPLRITHFGDWIPLISGSSGEESGSKSTPNPENSETGQETWQLILKPLPYKYIKRASLEGMQLKAVTVGVRQYMSNFNRNAKGELEVTGGLFGGAFTTFEESINFTYTLKYIPGYAYGKIKAQGDSWTGVVGLLVNKRADIAICGISQSKWRSSVIDLTAPLLFQSSRLFVSGSPSPYQLDLYFRPFTGGLWMMLSAWFLLLALFQQILRLAHGFLMDRCGGKGIHIFREKIGKENMNLDIFYSVCHTLDKGSCLGKDSASTRLMIFSGSILFTVASTGYSAKLTSIQAVHRFIPEVETIDELSRAQDWEMGLLNRSWDRWIMQNALTNSTMESLWTEKIEKNPSNLFKYPQEGLLKASQNKRFAYLGDSLECRLMLSGTKVGAIEDDLEEIQGDEFKFNSRPEEEVLPPNVACEVVELPGDVVKIGSSFALQKYSPIKDIFNYNLIKLWSSGILRILRKRYVEPPGKLCNLESTFQPASIGDTFFSLIIFGGGALLSLIILASELSVAKVVHGLHKKRRKLPKIIPYTE